MSKISVFSLDKKFNKFEKEIKGIALKILKILKKEDVAVEIYLVGDKIMKELNKKFRGKNKAANVLSFVEPKNFPRPEIKGKFLGEIYLNFESSILNSQFSILYLLIHGLLHLSGYAHKKKNDRIKMEKKERSLITQIFSK